MYKTVMSLALALGALSSGAAQAQERPADGHDSSIVVEGSKQGPRKESRTFVRRIVTTTKDQLARFNDPVCPVVVGLPPAYAKAVIKRFRAVSVEAGARVDGDEKCHPNIFVIIAADAGKIITELREKYHGFFNDLAYDDKRTALDDGPVRAWRVTEELDQTGRPGAGGGDGPRSFSGVDPGSRISMSTQQSAFGAVVVMDVGVVEEKTVGQIADYVAMRVLAGARPPRAGARFETILSLFDTDGDVPQGLTEVDRSFLKGIYAMQANGRLGSQVGTIADQILRDGERAETPKKGN
ncbi:hypothetical protein [Sphingomonas sp. 1F27F7B]|jgi:hypothetical protein|nr:hypothetical protein [Sphingomonas sp. 1F27F7B]